MSGVAIVNALLSADAGVTQLVPAARVFSGPVALPAQMPVVAIRQIDDVEETDLAMSGTRMLTERVQVTVYAGSYDEKAPILRAARDACVGRRGSVSGYSLDSILPGGTGPDLDDPGGPVFEQSTDFIVKWLR